MILIDHVRCAYCGGCVSVCPVEALSLAETRLEVSDDCIDCGDCTAACPVGALSSPEDGPQRQASRFKREYDLVVIGAGPGGSTAAQVAAQAGLSVLLLEKRQEIGSPVRCAEGVGHEQLATFIEPDRRWIAAEIRRAEISTLTDGAIQTLRVEGGLGYILERRVFDRLLAERAAQAGAEVRVKTAASGLLIENRRRRGGSAVRVLGRATVATPIGRHDGLRPISVGGRPDRSGVQLFRHRPRVGSGRLCLGIS
jgi:NAD-dependent dihydropyrimidine dehydrogenase PreA subunit